MISEYYSYEHIVSAFCVHLNSSVNYNLSLAYQSEKFRKKLHYINQVQVNSDIPNLSLDISVQLRVPPIQFCEF